MKGLHAYALLKVILIIMFFPFYIIAAVAGLSWK